MPECIHRACFVHRHPRTACVSPVLACLHACSIALWKPTHVRGHTRGHTRLRALSSLCVSAHDAAQVCMGGGFRSLRPVSALERHGSGERWHKPSDRHGLKSLRAALPRVVLAMHAFERRNHAPTFLSQRAVAMARKFPLNTQFCVLHACFRSAARIQTP